MNPHLIRLLAFARTDLRGKSWFHPSFPIFGDVVALAICGLVAAQWGHLLRAHEWTAKQVWLYESIDALQNEVFLVNAIFGAALFLFFRIFFVGWLSTILAITTSMGLAAISLEKVRQLGMPLLPWDFLFASDAASFAEFVSVGSSTLALVPMAFLAILFSLRRTGTRLFRRSRFLPAAVLGLLPISFWSTAVASGYVERVSQAGIHNIEWDQEANFHNYGPYYTLVSNWRFLAIAEPEPVDLHAAYEVDVGAKTALSQKGLFPDVVTVLSESFTDLPVRIFNQPFTCLANAPLSELITPAWGGLTANVEFELLTGYPHAIFPVGSIPYQMYVTKPVKQSLPSQFTNAGFEASAIHTYSRNFFSRPKAYEMLGFSQYHGVEDFTNMPRRGFYVGDDALFDEVLRRLDQPARKPQFIHAVTMMAHQPYDRPDRYPVSEKIAKALPASLEAYRLPLTQYAALIYDHEKMVCSFLRSLTKRARRTIVIFYGDHYPTFGSFEVYKALHSHIHGASGVPFDLYKQFSRTPLFLFDSKKGFIPIAPAVPSYNLGTLLLNYVDIPANQIWSMPHKLHNRLLTSTVYAASQRTRAVLGDETKPKNVDLEFRTLRAHAFKHLLSSGEN